MVNTCNGFLRTLRKGTLLALCLYFLSSIGYTKERTPQRPALMAHRGLVQLAPENTLSSFAMALELRLDIELDVYLTADNEVVVLHDQKVDRTTDGTGDVTQMTLVEVKELDAGSWFHPAFSGERIPTLGETLGFIKRRQKHPTMVAINMKTISPDIEKLVVQEVVRHDMLTQVFCFGMDLDSNSRFKKANSKIPTAITTHNYGQLNLLRPADWRAAVTDPHTEIFWIHFLPSAEQIAQAHAQNKRIWLYILDDRDLMRRAATSNLDGVCSDYILDIRKMKR